MNPENKIEMQIRYKLHRDMYWLYLHEDSRADDPSSVISLKEYHSSNIPIFVDVLGKGINRNLLKVRAYFPEGLMVKGYVLRDYVGLHHVGDIFDGRFNVRAAT